MPGMRTSTAWLTFGFLCLQARLSVGARNDAKDITGLGPGMAGDRQNGLDCTPVWAGALFGQVDPRESTCPVFMVKRCRYCPYEENGCQNCFKLDTTTGQGKGILCAKAHMSSKCTSKGMLHPKCNLNPRIDADKVSKLFQGIGKDEGAKEDIRIDTNPYIRMECCSVVNQAIPSNKKHTQCECPKDFSLVRSPTAVEVEGYKNELAYLAYFKLGCTGVGISQSVPWYFSPDEITVGQCECVRAGSYLDFQFLVNTKLQSGTRNGTFSTGVQ